MSARDEPRTCACDCGQPLDGRRGNTRYVDPRHRQRAYRKRLAIEAEANGLSANLSLRSVRASTRTRKRHRDAGRASRAPDLRVSYDKAARHVATVLAAHPLYVGEPLARRLAEEGLRAALTPRQRAALERRGTS